MRTIVIHIISICALCKQRNIVRLMGINSHFWGFFSPHISTSSVNQAETPGGTLTLHLLLLWTNVSAVSHFACFIFTLQVHHPHILACVFQFDILEGVLRLSRLSVAVSTIMFRIHIALLSVQSVLSVLF